MGIVVPDPVWASVRQLGERHGYGSLKSICTVGMGLISGMPEHTRLGLLKWIAQASVDGPGSITSEAIWAEAARLLRDDLGNAQVIGSASPVPPPGGKPEDKRVSPPDDDGLTHEVTRILDPAFLAKKKRGVA